MSLFKKILKILGFIVLGILILLIIASVIIGPIAKDYLEDEINEADKGQYSAQIDNVNVSIIRGNFVIEGLRIQTDTLLAREQETPVIDLQAGEISVRGLSWLQFLLTNKLQMNGVNFIDLVVEAKVRTIDDGEDEDDGPFRWEDLDIYPMVKDQVDRIRLNDLNFSNIDLTLINIETIDTLFFNAEEFHVNSDDILIDADRVFTDARAFYASEIDIQGKDVQVNMEGNIQWQLDLALIEFATRGSDFGMLTENVQFFKRGDTREDTVLFAAYREFNMTDLDLNRVQEDSVAKIGTIFLTDLNIINNMVIEEAEEAAEEAADEAEDELEFDTREFTLGDMLPELLDRVSITEISLENLNFRQHEEIHVKGIGFFTRDLVIDKNPAFADNRFLHARQIEISINTVNFSEDNMHVALNDFQFAMNDGLGNFKMNNLEARMQGEMNAQASVDVFEITGIDTRELKEDRFAIDRFSIIQPEIVADMSAMANGNGEAAENGELDLYPAIEEYLDELRINKFEIREADVRLSGVEGINETVRLPNINFEINDLLIAEGTAFQGDRILHAEDISVGVDRIRLPLPDNIHEVYLHHFSMSTGEGSLVVEGLKYDHLGDTDKALENPDVDQVFTVTNDHFSIQNLDYSSLMREVGFYAGTIRMTGLDAEIFGELMVDEEEAEEAAEEADEAIDFDVARLTLGDYLPEGLDAVFISNIILRDINVRQRDFVKVGGMNFTARQMGIDNRSAFADNRFLHAKTLNISIDTVKFIEQEELLQISLDDLNFEMTNGTGSFGIQHMSARHLEDDQSEMNIDADLNFQVTGIDTRELTDRIFSINRIAFEQPRVYANLGGEMVEIEEEEAEEAAEDMEMDLYPAIEDMLKELRINKIAIVDADIELAGVSEFKNVGRLPKLNFEISDLLLAEGTAFEGDRVFHAKDIALQMENIDVPLPDGVYRAQLDNFDMSTGENYFRLDNFSFGYNENFRKILEGPETNMVFSVASKRLVMEDMDYGLMLKEEGVHIGAITSEGLDIHVYLDNNFPAEEEEQDLPPTLQEVFKDLDMNIFLGDLSVIKANLVYEELAEGGEEPGKFTLEDINVNVDKLTNVESIIGDHHETRININAKVMGEGFFKAELVIPMHDSQEPVRFIGNLDSLDLTSLNRYTEYTTLFGFESGMIYTLLWDFQASRQTAEGIFGLSYENLAIQLSESDSPEPAGFLYQAGAYLANALVIDSDKSEDRSDPPKKVDFVREKDEEESFIEHYLSAIMAGFVEIMGFPLSIIDP